MLLSWNSTAEFARVCRLCVSGDEFAILVDALVFFTAGLTATSLLLATLRPVSLLVSAVAGTVLPSVGGRSVFAKAILIVAGCVSGAGGRAGVSSDVVAAAIVATGATCAVSAVVAEGGDVTIEAVST
jgi:hypothetical protein